MDPPLSDQSSRLGQSSGPLPLTRIKPSLLCMLALVEGVE